MKKLICLPFLLFFTFSKNMIGQSPRIAEKVIEIKDSNDYQIQVRNIYHYHQNGELSLIEGLYYDNNEINGRSGIFYEYDDKDRLIKEMHRFYNLEVDLWITASWKEFLYDENNCLNQSLLIINVGADSTLHSIISDQECREIERINLTNLQSKTTNDYIDNNGSYIRTEYYLDNNNWKKSSVSEVLFNEEEDQSSNIFYLFADNEIDTALQIFRIYDHSYFHNLNGELERKETYYYRNSFPYESPDTSLIQIKKYEYLYYCDGLLKQEEEHRQNVSSPESINMRRSTYFYEGKNECFEPDEKLEAHIYPNPSSGAIKIQSNILESGDTDILVFSFDGKLIFEKKSVSRKHELDVNLAILNNGVYVIQLRSGKHFVSKKLVMTK